MSSDAWEIKTSHNILGGRALIIGSRRLSPNARVLRSLLEAGLAVISIDYRLAPETKLPAIVEDVQDAFRWIRAHASTLQVDSERGTMAFCWRCAATTWHLTYLLASKAE